MLRLRLLGELALEVDGRPLGAPLGTRAAALLGWLALNPGPRARADLAPRFWPDVLDTSARASLRTAIWELRRGLAELDPNVVEVTRETIGLSGRDLWVDALAVRDLAAAGRAQEALDLCRGELLAGLSADWIDIARDEHRALVAELMERLAAEGERAGRMDDAVGWSRRRAAAAPLDEAAARALMRRLVAAGDRAEAVAVGRRLTARLRQELAMPPSPATRELIAGLRGPERLDNPEPPDSADDGQMMGRDADLLALARAASAAAAGRGAVVAVTGEGGIGKTRLTSELVRRARTQGAIVASAGAADLAAPAPYSLWADLLRDLVDRLPAPPAGAAWPAELARLDPAIQDRWPRAAPAPPGSPILERVRLRGAAAELVAWASAVAPLVLVMDDVHRADRASLELAAHIAGQIGAMRVLLVVTRRDRPPNSDVDALLAGARGRGVPVLERELESLADADVAAIVRSRADLGDDDLRRVVAAAEGSPLLAVEATRALASGERRLWSSLRASVRAAVGGLPVEGRELTALAAAAGRALGRAEIAALALDDPQEATRQAIAADVLAAGSGRIGFRHALLRDAAYADLMDPAGLHERIALALEAAAGAAPAGAAEVARHLRLAGRDELAGPRLAAAARRARELGALDEAAGFWREAADCRPNDPDSCLELADVEAWRGRPDAMEAALAAALERLPDERRAEVWLRRGHVHRTVMCHPTAALTAYRMASDLLGAAGPPPARAEALRGLAWCEAVVGDPGAVDELLARAQGLQPTGDELLAADADIVRAFMLIRRGRFAESCDAARAAGSAADRAGRPDIALIGWTNGASAATCIGEFEQALTFTDRGYAATARIPALAAKALAARAYVHARLGNHAAARADARERLDLAAGVAEPGELASAHLDLGMIALSAGDDAEAARELAIGLEGNAQTSRPAARLALAEALAALGQVAEAAAEVRAAALEPVGPADVPASLVPRMSRTQALVALARGDRAAATRLFEEAAAGWRRLGGAMSGDDYMANVVDLGRPPVAGLVEPSRELARVEGELAALAMAVS